MGGSASVCVCGVLVWERERRGRKGDRHWGRGSDGRKKGGSFF